MSRHPTTMEDRRVWAICERILQDVEDCYSADDAKELIELVKQGMASMQKTGKWKDVLEAIRKHGDMSKDATAEELGVRDYALAIVNEIACFAQDFMISDMESWQAVDKLENIMRLWECLEIEYLKREIKRTGREDFYFCRTTGHHEIKGFLLRLFLG